MIAIPVLTLVPGRLGGSETYVEGLFSGLARSGSRQYRVIVPPLAPSASGALACVVASEYPSATTIPSRLGAMLRGRFASGGLARYLDDADVVHFPLTVAIPRTRKPHVVTLHDVQHLDLPSMFSRGERTFRHFIWHTSVERADRVIVVSEFARNRAVERLGLDPSKLRVIYSGVDHDTLSPGSREREPFLLYPARRWPHKNHVRLFDAFAELRRERSDLRLVLTGGGDFSDAPDGVESRGHVGKAELVALMQRASALVFPSLYEGFGLPPLEAMACGCPVACSDAGALPEVVGDAARLFDPHDPHAIAEAVRDVLADPSPWVERGLAQAARYSWDDTARGTDAVYGELSTRA